MAGDLNDIAPSSKKIGGVAFDFRRASLFNRRINQCSLIDMGFNGPPFTWRGTRRGGVIVQERLYRALALESWRLQYPEASVFHLPRAFSDHSPLLIDMHVQPQVRFHRPFHFEAMWTTHASFECLLQNSWRSIVPIVEAIHSLTDDIKTWNDTVFGNLFHDKRRFLARIAGVQRQPAYSFSNFL